ncbi:GNAT family N-acetyltransferase [Actinospica sp.]|uniref:GNAT family N-acetyltransferase n=1 Tax=Actinospica sp. TaxID=1872142 RepID=UPI002C195CD9|nr:GNAT family N-acetyltransferase [Actinospica sp.]HWG26857.1 GNAT family N-acetyltransferase [Actinospica sp.]
MEIAIDDLSSPEIIELLHSHLAEMKRVTPREESVHALDLHGLRQPEVTFWSLRDGDRIAGCGAIKRFDATHAEIKSMRTAASFQRRGVAARLLAHIEAESIRMGLTRLSLETGAEDYFAPARALYLRSGFEYCEPFGSYMPDSLSVFMTKAIA